MIVNVYFNSHQINPATSSACVLSNPLEVCKTRMQLQGELVSKSATSATVKQYKNVFHAFYTILTKEGIAGLQRGLAPGIAYQAAMNGVRLGAYPPLKSYIGAEPDKPFYFIKNMCAGATTGVFGGKFSLHQDFKKLHYRIDIE